MVVDVLAEVADDPDFLLEPEHLEAWETDNGRIPDNAWVLLRTGWAVHGGSQENVLNADQNGPHTPGPSAGGLQVVGGGARHHGFRGGDRGHRRGWGGCHGPGLPVHYYLLGAGKLGLTQFQQLERLPRSAR